MDSWDPFFSLVLDVKACATRIFVTALWDLKAIRVWEYISFASNFDKTARYFFVPVSVSMQTLALLCLWRGWPKPEDPGVSGRSSRLQLLPLLDREQEAVKALKVEVLEAWSPLVPTTSWKADWKCQKNHIFFKKQNRFQSHNTYLFSSCQAPFDGSTVFL